MSLVFVLLLSVIPARIWAQDYQSNTNTTQNTQIRDYENGFLFNVFEIANVEERVQLASALATSNIWLCNPTENPGELFIRPNSYNADIPIYAEFDYLRMTLREEYEEVSSLPKEEFAAIYNSWASTISQDYYNFLIADHLDRANHCMDAEPFCTSDVYNFPALNSGYSWEGPNYGCLRTSPTTKHSFWYYMRIGVAGNITILIEASFDVDFALWGPFSNQIDPCPTEAGQTGLLTADCSDCPNNTSTTQPNFYPSGNLHDCSFDARHYEYAHVVNGEVGQYFILLITNYSGSDGSITFQKFAGDGETDCGIMPGIAGNDGPYCVGQTIHLTVNEQPNATYLWTGPDGWTSTEPNPTRENCTLDMAGTYTIITTVGAQTTPANTVVNVYEQPTPSFTASTVCFGEATVFEGLATGANVANYDWDFGDGNNASGQNVSHTFAEPGTYPVTLTVTAEDGTCPGEITQTVVVNAQPVADAGPDQTLPYPGTSTEISGTGGSDSFTYHWDPANMVVNPNSPTTQTITLYDTQTYTLTVTNPEGECTSTDEVTVYIGSSPLSVTGAANPSSICLDESTQLQVDALGGSSDFSYSWTPSAGLSATNIPNPIATPTQTTSYTCTVTDNTALYTQSVSITVTVNMPEHLADSIISGECNRVALSWHGQDTTFYANTEYTFVGQTDAGCHREQTFHIENMMYTPAPAIECADDNIEWPHHPITATEFNVNRYTYHASDSLSDHTWFNSECEWTISKESWRIEPSDDNRSCDVYPMDFVEDTIWLTFKAVSPCSGDDGIIARYWLKPSFYSISEDAFIPTIDIVPNPNNGQMELRIENMEGKVDVKVCSATGLMLDHFDIRTLQGLNTYNYTMERLSNGVYFFVFTDGKHSVTKKVVIIN